jgi:hypothetical protein
MNKHMDDGEYIHMGGVITTTEQPTERIAITNQSGDVTMEGYDEVVTYNRILNSVDIGKDLKVKTEDDETITKNEHGEFIKKVIDGLFKYNTIKEDLIEQYNFDGINYNKKKLEEDIFTKYRSYETEIPILKDDDSTFCNNPQKVKTIDYVYAIQDAGNSPEHLFCNYKLIITPGTIIDPAGKTKHTKKNQKIINIANNELIKLDNNFIKKYALDSAIKNIDCVFNNTTKRYNITITLNDDSHTQINCTFDSSFKAIDGDKDYFQGNPYKNKYILDNFSRQDEQTYQNEVKKYLLVKELGDTLQVAYLDELLTYVEKTQPTTVAGQFPELISTKTKGGVINDEENEENEDIVPKGFNSISRKNTYITTNDKNVLYRSLINNLNCSLQQGKNKEHREVVYRDLIPEEELKLLRKQKKEVIDDIIGKNNNVIQLLKTIATGDNVDKITLDGKQIGYLAGNKIDKPETIKLRKIYMKNALNYMATCLEIINKNIHTILELITIVSIEYYDNFVEDCNKFLFENPFKEINSTYELSKSIQSIMPNIIGTGIEKYIDTTTQEMSTQHIKLDCGGPDYIYKDIIKNRYYKLSKDVNINNKKVDEDVCKNIPIEDLAKYLYDNYQLEDEKILDVMKKEFIEDYITESIDERCFSHEQIYGTFISPKKEFKGKKICVVVSFLFNEIITTYQKKFILIHNRGLNPDVDLNIIDESTLSQQEFINADINIYEKNDRYIKLIKNLETIFIKYVNDFNIVSSGNNIFQYIGWYISTPTNSNIQGTLTEFELVINPYIINFGVEKLQINIPTDISDYNIKKIINILPEDKQKEESQNENISMENNKNEQIKNEQIKNTKKLICKMIYLDDEIKIQELIKNCLIGRGMSEEEINDRATTIYTMYQKLHCGEDTAEDIEDLKAPFTPAAPKKQKAPTIPQQVPIIEQPVTTRGKQPAPSQKQVSEQQKAVAELQKITSVQQEDVKELKKAVTELQNITSVQQKAVTELQKITQLIKQPTLPDTFPSTFGLTTVPPSPSRKPIDTQPSQQPIYSFANSFTPRATPPQPQYVFGQLSTTPRAQTQVTGQKRGRQSNLPDRQSKISSFFTRPQNTNNSNNSNNSMLGGANIIELSNSTNSMNYYIENKYADSPGLFTYHMLCFFPRIIFLATSFFKVIKNNNPLNVTFEKLYKQPELLQSLENVVIELFDYETSLELNEVFLNMNDGPNYIYDIFEEDPTTQTQQIEKRKKKYIGYDNATKYLCHFCYHLINDCKIEYDNNKLLLTDLQFINDNLFEKITELNEDELFNNFKDNSVYKYRLIEYYDLLFNMEYYITATNNSKYMNTIQFLEFRIKDNIYMDPSIVREEIEQPIEETMEEPVSTPIKQVIEQTSNMELNEETPEEKRRTIIKQRYPSINDNIIEQIEEQIQRDPRRTKFFTNDSTRDKMIQDAYKTVMTRTVAKKTPAPVPKTGRKLTNTEQPSSLTETIKPTQLMFGGGGKRITHKKNKKHKVPLKNKTIKRKLKHLKKTSKKNHKKAAAKQRTHKKRR